MEENVQVSNTPENGVPESTTTSSGDDFFEALDTQVNSGILDLPLQEQTTFDDSDEQAGEEYLQQQAADQSPVEGKKPVDIENLQTRYSDSSREAKKLNSKLKEIEPYMPILDAMREAPNLIQHVRNYFEGGGQAPVYRFLRHERRSHPKYSGHRDHLGGRDFHAAERGKELRWLGSAPSQLLSSQRCVERS